MRIELQPACCLGLVVLALLSACPKTGSSTGSGETTTKTESKARFQGATREFAEALTSRPVLGWTIDPSGVPVVYDELRFQTDGSFEASASVRLSGGEDPFLCTERGSWSFNGEGAESRTEADIHLEVSHTDCAGREAPPAMNARAVISTEETQLTLH